MRALTALILLGLALPAGAATYRWVDEDGQVHYSDRPRPDAEEVELRGAQTYSGRPQPQRSRETSSETTPPADAQPLYESLRLVRPAPSETFRNIGGQLAVTLSLTPALKPGHRVRVYYDGTEVANWPGQSLSFTLTDVYRGEHNLRAEVVDGDGNPVASTETVTFFVHQTNLFQRVRN